jgi:hypothetical protein
MTIERKKITEAYLATLDEYDKLLDKNEISEEEYEELKTEALDDLMLMLEEYDGLNYDDEESEYNMGNNIAEFSVEPINRFGAALLEIGELGGYTDLQDYISDLSEMTGNAPGDILDLINGDALPSEDFSDYVSDMFGLDDDLADDLYDATLEAYEDEGYEIEEEGYYEDDDLEGYYEDNLEEDYDDAWEDGYMEEIDPLEEEVQYSQARIDQLENTIAEFQTSQNLKNALDERMIYAAGLVQEGKMPPVVAETLFGEFNTEDDRVAAFSAVAQSNGVSLEAELHSIDKVLEIFDSLDGLAYFSSDLGDITEEEEEEMIEELAAEEQAILNAELRRLRNEGSI